ncbi:hypothetical protein TIFTF001_052368 [Ficus carica]|uniref:Uncharacterized protein n=1 Tax=Ficus carica TaxID=3494 RepID=A0AA88EGA0_FICCA|nr:hypothetical protein TIFTF001_052367 [Ficus carica]GMN74415.1 hypothetical protein TIFTF001_052368 [Ficus carica]
MLSTFSRSSFPRVQGGQISRALKLVYNRASSTTVTSGFTSNTATVTTKLESYTTATSGYTSNTATVTVTVTAEFKSSATQPPTPPYTKPASPTNLRVRR